MNSIKLTIKGGLEDLAELRKAVSLFIGGSLDETEKNRVVLSIDEAAANIMIHGRKISPDLPLEVDMKREPGRLTFILCDGSPPFNSLARPELDIDEYISSGRHGGLGVYLYKKLMKASYERDPAGMNRLTLVKELKDEN